MTGRIIVFAGFAGSGKTTIIKELLGKSELFSYIPSVTTREKRDFDGEIEGKPYFFRTLEEFNKIKKSGELLEYEEIHGNYYGTYTTKYYDKLKEGKVILKDIGVEGAISFREEFGDKVRLVFIKTPEDNSIVERMRTRGNSEEDINNRLKRIEYEASFINKFDKVIVNDELNKAVDDIVNYINNEFNKSI